MNKEEKKLLRKMVQLYIRTNFDDIKDNGKKIYNLELKILNSFNKLEDIQKLLNKE